MFSFPSKSLIIVLRETIGGDQPFIALRSDRGFPNKPLASSTSPFNICRAGCGICDPQREIGAISSNGETACKS